MSGGKIVKGKKDEISCPEEAKALLFISLTITWKAGHVLNEYEPLRKGIGKQNIENELATICLCGCIVTRKISSQSLGWFIHREKKDSPKRVSRNLES